MVAISSLSNSLRGTLLRHSTTASLTSSFGTYKQLNRAYSLLASFNDYETSSKIGDDPAFSASSQKKLISLMIAMNNF